MAKPKPLDPTVGFPTEALEALVTDLVTIQAAKLAARVLTAQRLLDALRIPEPKAKRTRNLGSRSKIIPAATITVNTGNPYRVGTKAHATFNLFYTSATVREFYKLVALQPEAYDPGYLRYSSRDGYITIGDPQ